MNNVGMLVGPNGTTVASGDVIKIEHKQQKHLRIYAYNNDLKASDQGVYTCHIPLQSGENRSINVGLYPSGFSSKCLLLYIASSEIHYCSQGCNKASTVQYDACRKSHGVLI